MLLFVVASPIHALNFFVKTFSPIFWMINIKVIIIYSFYILFILYSCSNIFILFMLCCHTILHQSARNPTPFPKHSLASTSASWEISPTNSILRLFLMGTTQSFALFLYTLHINDIWCLFSVLSLIALITHCHSLSLHPLIKPSCSKLKNSTYTRHRNERNYIKLKSISKSIWAKINRHPT